MTVFIFRYTAGEIHFNLMAIVPNLRAKYEQRIVELSTVLLLYFRRISYFITKDGNGFG